MLHPRKNDAGHPVTIQKPHQPTPVENLFDSKAAAVIVPEGPIQDELNGIAFRSWTDREWQNVSGQTDFQEPPMQGKPGKKIAAGAVIFEPDGRIWLAAPTNAFGGYKATFPKGRIEQGMTLQTVAIKETYEETGLQVDIIGFLGDFERTTTMTRYYLARRIGGNPAEMGWESQAVILAPLEQLEKIADHPSDQPIIKALKEIEYVDFFK